MRLKRFSNNIYFLKWDKNKVIQAIHLQNLYLLLLIKEESKIIKHKLIEKVLVKSLRNIRLNTPHINETYNQKINKFKDTLQGNLHIVPKIKISKISKILFKTIIFRYLTILNKKIIRFKTKNHI